MGIKVPAVVPCVDAGPASTPCSLTVAIKPKYNNGGPYTADGPRDVNARVGVNSVFTSQTVTGGVNAEEVGPASGGDTVPAVGTRRAATRSDLFFPGWFDVIDTVHYTPPTSTDGQPDVAPGPGVGPV